MFKLPQNINFVIEKLTKNGRLSPVSNEYQTETRVRLHPGLPYSIWVWLEMWSSQ